LLLRRGMGYAKVIHKKREKERNRKKWQVFEILKNNGYLDVCLKKREMNKIAHVLLQKSFQVSKDRYIFKEQSRIRLATTYIHLIYPHTCTSWFDCMTQLSLVQRFDFIIYTLQVCSSFLPTYELHIKP
jgi:hypothetical protein